MARIPIIKLNNGNTSYYPLSVGESTVTTHNIEVKNDIGGYQKGDTIPAVTTFDEILTNLFETEGSGSEVVIDNITIVRNLNDELCVDLDEIFSNKNCDEVTATRGLIINSISQTDGKISVSVRALEGDDIPTITTTQVNGLDTRLTDLEAPLTKDKIPNIDITQVNNLSTKLSETIDVSRIPTIPISRVDGLSEALEVPIVQDWGPWTKQGESGECYRVFWDNSQWKYKNDDGNLVTFDSGLPSTTSPDAYQLVIGELVFCRHKQQCSVVTVPGLKRALTAEDSTGYNSISSNKSIIGRIKQLEAGGGTGTVKSVNGVEPDTAGNVTLSKLVPDSEGKVWTGSKAVSIQATKQTTGSFNSVCYGKGRYIAASNANGIWYSDDGLTWQISNKNDGKWNVVRYANGKYVAGSDNQGIAYSTDGLTWTISKSGGTWQDITYGNDKFVACSNSGIFYSTDGLTWKTTSITSDKWNGVTYGNGKFVAVPYDANSSEVSYSTDGINWQEGNVNATANPPDWSWYDVAYGNGRFIATTNFASTCLWTSTNGIDWEACESCELSNDHFDGLVYSHGLFIICSSTRGIWVSEDGLTWTRTNKTNGHYYDFCVGGGKLLAASYNNGIWYSDYTYGEILSESNVAQLSPTSSNNEIQNIIGVEVSNKLDEMKFSVADTAEIFTLQDVVRILKNVLIKLGMQEEAITINTSAFES